MSRHYWICYESDDGVANWCPIVDGPFDSIEDAEAYAFDRVWLKDAHILQRLDAEKWLCDLFFVEQ